VWNRRRQGDRRGWQDRDAGADRVGIVNEGELTDIANADVEAARAAIARHRDVIAGVKVRVSRNVAGSNAVEALRRARQAVKPFGLPLMVHIGQSADPLPAILAELERGDVVTHVYAPPPNGIYDAEGRVLPEVHAARRRGILFDVGNGRGGHIVRATAKRGIFGRAFWPDTISSDITAPRARLPSSGCAGGRRRLRAARRGVRIRGQRERAGRGRDDRRREADGAAQLARYHDLPRRRFDATPSIGAKPAGGRRAVPGTWRCPHRISSRSTGTRSRQRVVG
jgi:hypothetical protein